MRLRALQRPAPVGRAGRGRRRGLRRGLPQPVAVETETETKTTPEARTETVTEAAATPQQKPKKETKPVLGPGMKTTKPLETGVFSCPVCGADVAEDAVQCGSCGELFKGKPQPKAGPEPGAEQGAIAATTKRAPTAGDAGVCGKCGEPFEPGMAYCRVCGEQL